MQSDPNKLPRALAHQRKVVQAITAMLNMDADALSALQRGGSRVLEKVVRSYHYWVEEHPPSGVCPYDHPLLGYFRISPAAAEAGANRALRCEHAVPVRVIVNELVRQRYSLGKLSLESVEEVMRANEVVVLTRTEAALLDKRYRAKMPGDGTLAQSRLRRLELVLGLAEDDLLGARLIGPHFS